MSEQISVTLPGYQWEAILRGLASSGWDSMHALLTEKLAAGVATEEPEWEYGEQSKLDPDRVWIVDPISQPMIWADIPAAKRVRRRAAGPWVPVEQEGAEQ